MHIFSASAFIAYVNETFKAIWDPTEACLEGEVSGYRVSQGQWVNFDIKDDPSTGSGQGDALVSVFMVLRNQTVTLQDGMRVRLFGYPRVYPKFGKFSFNADRVELVGEGTLKKALAALRAKLDAEGLFDPSRKRKLPRFPGRIALVASRESAAYGDFVRIVNERWNGLLIDVYHVVVQGADAPASIVKAIEMANVRVLPLRDPAVLEAPRGGSPPSASPAFYDALVLTRGGGSFEELMAFNDERLVRAIYASKIPTLVGIGHERDLTLAEEVADVRGATPTDCARRLVPDRKDILYQIAHQQEGIGDALDVLIADWQREIEDRLQSADHWIQRMRDRSDALIRLFASYDPEAVVRRGYAIVRDAAGKVRTGIEGLQGGDGLDVRLSDGNLETTIRSVIPAPDRGRGLAPAGIRTGFPFSRE